MLFNICGFLSTDYIYHDIDGDEVTEADLKTYGKKEL